jgi:hypothetical protein
MRSVGSIGTGRTWPIPARRRPTCARPCFNGSRSVLRRSGHGPVFDVRESRDAPDGETMLLAAQARESVLAALRRLPERQREALVLRYYLDLAERVIQPVRARTRRRHVPGRRVSVAVAGRQRHYRWQRIPGHADAASLRPIDQVGDPQLAERDTGSSRRVPSWTGRQSVLFVYIPSLGCPPLVLLPATCPASTSSANISAAFPDRETAKPASGPPWKAERGAAGVRRVVPPRTG